MGEIARVMRWNLLWYGPLAALWIVLIIIPVGRHAYKGATIVFHHFSWLVWVSPSNYLFWASTIGSVTVPIYGLFAIPALFNREAQAYRRRYLWSCCVVIGCMAMSVLCSFVSWGSFPLATDRVGFEHVRMIPFFPWPDTPFF
jgi:hypothetical protein